MKVLKTGAVVLLGMVLAGPAWGHSGERYGYTPGLMSVAVNGHTVTVGWSSDSARDRVALGGGTCSFVVRVGERIETGNGRIDGTEWWFESGQIGIFDWPQSFVLPDSWHGRQGDVLATMYCSSALLSAHAHGRLDGAPPEPPTPPEPEPPEPEPPEPEPPEPPAPPPEPETPEPEACPAEPRCDHLAIVAAMPRGLPGDDDAADHWVRITNPGAASIRFTIEGRDDAGAKGGTYRRELPAYRSVKVKMRDIQAAFDVTDPEGWWTLTVAGSGPLYVRATMKQGDARRFVPVERPATCGTGPVTRAGD